MNQRVALDDETARWLGQLGDRMARKLARVGLMAKRSSARLGPFLADYKASRVDLKSSTQIIHENVRRNLLAFFGPDKPLREITAGDADLWRLNLIGTEKLGPNTVRKRCGIAKQFFKSALRQKLVPENPFKDLVSVVRESDQARDYFITREEADKVLEACPNAQWRLLFALSRHGGLRCPSEHLALRWDGVNWESGRMLVHSPKTAHHPGGDARWVPIFPELRPYLDECWEQAEEKAEFVITQYRDATQNLRTQLEKIIQRAGLTAWPKLWHNLRSSRQTELEETFPSHVVCAWLGNSPQVARRHYLRVTDDHFARAAAGNAVETKAAQQTAGMLRNASHRGVSDSPGDPGDDKKNPDIPGDASDCDALRSGGGYLSERQGGRYWTRTSDLHDVNVAL
jgi:integrase